MRIDKFIFDDTKNAANLAKHGFGLDAFRGYDDDPLIIPDDRRDYGESRYRAFGRIGGLGYMIAFAVRSDHIRLISFRRAHEKEMLRYGR